VKKEWGGGVRFGPSDRYHRNSIRVAILPIKSLAIRKFPDKIEKCREKKGKGPRRSRAKVSSCGFHLPIIIGESTIYFPSILRTSVNRSGGRGGRKGDLALLQGLLRYFPNSWPAVLCA